jgi:hypothetical protein
MIRYALICENDDEFEAWFASSADYDRQAAAGLVECPFCAATTVRKAVMAPAVARRDRPGSERATFEKLAAKVRAHIRDTHDYVGERFAAEAQAMHEGETPHRPIWGEAKPDEAKSMIEEGLPVAPLPAPFAPTPPRKLN